MRLLWGILLGGVLAGAFDIVYAFVIYGPLSYGLTPQEVLQSVASGWLGREVSRAGGWSSAGLGLATHFLIATLMASAYAVAAQSFQPLKTRWVLWGLVYGLILYVAMNYVVVPLSAAATGHFASASEIVPRLQESFSSIRPRYDANYPWMIPGTIFTHTVLVALPIAWATQRLQTD
ncbi:MAG: hypothetical protein KF779_06845 [Hyphomonadaceae bacterium]|nr:hypothetical protein [Hyphomonadaceae bacterium]MCA8886645.1 hypothetical protein [Hyphomonadaceae bacterium]